MMQTVMARVLLTVISTNVYGFLNSVWCSIRTFAYVPERVHILTAEKDSEMHLMTLEMLSIILEEHGILEPEVVMHTFDNGDLGAIATLVDGIISDEVAEGNTFAIDSTPGKKNEMIACLARSLGHRSCEHVFYSELTTYENTRNPFILIPKQFINPFDIKKEARGA